jgi:hypothetical protein
MSVTSFIEYRGAFRIEKREHILQVSHPHGDWKVEHAVLLCYDTKDDGLNFVVRSMVPGHRVRFCSSLADAQDIVDGIIAEIASQNV